MFKESEPQEINPEDEKGEPTAEEILNTSKELWPDYAEEIEAMLEGSEDLFEAIGNLVTVLLSCGEDEESIFAKLSEAGILVEEN